VHLLGDQDFAAALLQPLSGRGVGVRIAPAGVRRMYAAALIRDLLLHWRNARGDLQFLGSEAKDIYGEAGDRWPALYQVLSYGMVLRYRQAAARRPGRPMPRQGTSLVAAYFDGLRWDGTTIP
jgi:hypothetical protein